MKTICVYCGSSFGVDSEYRDEAAALGKHLAENDIGLVYGGSDYGLMGVVSNSVLANDGRVVAVMPIDLQKRAGHKNGSELIIVESMHARKQKMFELADAFIALPGGFGTFDEIMEMLTWRQLGYHAKPCGFMNIRGYYNWLFTFLDHSLAQGFINAEHRAFAMTANNAIDMLRQLRGTESQEASNFE